MEESGSYDNADITPVDGSDDDEPLSDPPHEEDE
jgi:hypothetical protein